ncbi:hypothetical protein TWF788_007427 [Orbilia oligospora]|uniref:Uncharacterized protein n=1 Tax=Orbilia oligospora TaxID=2813651 RepID=A0A7C8PT95_ORBOL|nr:hypothetical protein TWF788_007427 [Orbilia oligospora]
MFELVWQRYRQMWPPIPDDEARKYIREEFDRSLFSIINIAETTNKGGRVSNSPAPLSVQNILDFKFPFLFLGEASFHQKLSTIRKIINDVDEVNRQKIFAHFMKKLFDFEESQLPTSQDQLRLSELVRCLQETGLDLDFAIDHFVRDSSKSFKVEDVGLVTKGGSGNETYLDISFRKSSPWLFILLLSCGADPRTLEDSFELGGRNEDRDEARVPRAMWLAAESRDYEAISGLWSSRISPLRPEAGENGLKLAVKDVIATVSRGQLDKATGIIFRPTKAKSPATVKFFSLLGDALVSRLNLKPELSSLADTAVTNFLISSITSPAFASAVGEWCLRDLEGWGPHDCERYCGKPKCTGIHPLSVQYLFYQTCFERVVVKSIQLGKVKVIAGLLEASGVAHRLTTWFPSSFRAYISAAVEHNLEILKVLVAAGPSIEELYKQGLRPLHKAIDSGQLNMVTYLLSEGADIRARAEGVYEYGLTAIQQAVRKGQLDTVALFLEVHPDCAKLALDAALEYRKSQPHFEKYIRNWVAKREMEDRDPTKSADNLSDRIPEAIARLGLSSDVLI